MHKLNILVCDDMEHVRLSHDHNIRQCAGTVFRPMIEMSESAEDAVKQVRESVKSGAPFDLIFMDIDFSQGQPASTMNGFEAATAISKLSPSTVIVIVSAYSTEDNLDLAEQCSHIHKFFRRGEYSKPELREACIFSLLRKLHAKNEIIPKEEAAFTRSKIMVDYLKKVDQISAEHSLVIFGETGTGKELTAKRINANARIVTGYETRPLVTINCGGLTATIQNSELFGFVKGAFTGANQDTPGMLEKAEGGDLFLDELQNAPMCLQEALMRVLDDKRFTPVGGKVSKTLNVRFLAALNKSPTEAKSSGTIKPDLLVRLQQDYLVIPPLRERRGDIPALIEHFKTINGKEDKSFSPGAISFLESLPWPTNVRGLRNVVREAIRHTKVPVISAEALMALPTVKEMLAEPTGDAGNDEISQSPEFNIEAFVADCIEGDLGFEATTKMFEKKLLTRLWKETPSPTRISRRAKLPEATVRRKLREHGIN